jgi:hypothetical protein
VETVEQTFIMKHRNKYPINKGCIFKKEKKVVIKERTKKEVLTTINS